MAIDPCSTRSSACSTSPPPVRWRSILRARTTTGPPRPCDAAGAAVPERRLAVRPGELLPTCPRLARPSAAGGAPQPEPGHVGDPRTGPDPPCGGSPPPRCSPSWPPTPSSALAGTGEDAAASPVTPLLAARSVAAMLTRDELASLPRRAARRRGRVPQPDLHCAPRHRARHDAGGRRGGVDMGYRAHRRAFGLGRVQRPGQGREGRRPRHRRRRRPPRPEGKVANWAEFGATARGSRARPCTTRTATAPTCAARSRGVTPAASGSGWRPRPLGGRPRARRRKGGTDAQVLAGIDWALDRSVHVISMSLGGVVIEPADARHLHARHRQLVPPRRAGRRRNRQRGRRHGRLARQRPLHPGGRSDRRRRQRGRLQQRAHPVRHPVGRHPAGAASAPLSQARRVGARRRRRVERAGRHVGCPSAARRWRHRTRVGRWRCCCRPPATCRRWPSPKVTSVSVLGLLIGGVRELGEAGQDHRYGFGRIDVRRTAAARGAGARDGRSREVTRQREAGKLTVRERIARLLDAGSFHEIGAFTGRRSYDERRQPRRLHPRQLRARPRRHRRPHGRRRRRRLHRAWRRRRRVDRQKQVPPEQMAHELGLPIVRLVDGTGGGGSVKTLETDRPHARAVQSGLEWVVDDPRDGAGRRAGSRFGRGPRRRARRDLATTR